MADLILSSDSLYRNGEVIEFENGEQLLLRDTVEHIPQPKDIHHSYREGELLDSIAWKRYKGQVDNSERYWWAIADANEIQEPLNLDDYPYATTFIIPDIQSLLLRI